MPVKSVWLLRHGQSTSNAGLPATGNGEVPLTALGVAQADGAADRVTRAPDLIVSSPFLRARATAAPIIRRWPQARQEIWPIQEFTYLSPARCVGTTAATRLPMVNRYWKAADPLYVDGPDCESYAGFVRRISAFHDRLAALDADFVVVAGHGQFFRAYGFGVANNFACTPEWMLRYREMEVGNPMANCEIIELSFPGALDYRVERTISSGSART